MPRFVRVLGITIALLLVVGLSGFWGLGRALQRMPEFYRHALANQPPRRASDELERNVLDLRNNVRRPGRWEARFTDEQFNGWLAVVMPEKFPQLLPKSVKEPRVAFSPDRIQLACRHEGAMTSIIHLSLDADLTDEPNVIAIRIHSARTGLFPLPLKKVLDEVTRRAHESRVVLRWSQIDGDPVALVTIPSRHEAYEHTDLSVLELTLSDGQVFIAGEANVAATH